MSLERDLRLLTPAGEEKGIAMLGLRGVALTPEQVLITEETVERALQALHELDEVTSRLLILVYGYCQSLDEASCDLCMTPAALKQRLWRARQDARERFQRQGIAPW